MLARIYTASVWALILALAFFGAAAWAIPTLLGYETRTVLTQSMKDAGMPAGSQIAIETVAPSQIRIGDVVTYQRVSGKESAVTHRIIGMSTGPDGTPRWVTKGDSNPKRDPTPIREEQVIGRLVVLDLPVFGATPYIVPLAGHFAIMPMGQKVAGFVGLLALAWWIPDLFTKLSARRQRLEARKSRDAEPEPELI